MGSGIIEAEFLLASVGRVESAGVYGVQVVVREEYEGKERRGFREYLGSRERVLVGDIGEAGSAGSHGSVEDVHGKPENRVVDVLRRGIINPRIGLGRQYCIVFRVGRYPGEVVYGVDSRSKGNRQFGIGNPVQRRSCRRNIRSVPATGCRRGIYPVGSVPRYRLTDCRGRRYHVRQLVQRHRNEASWDVLDFRFLGGRVDLQGNVVYSSEHAEFVVPIDGTSVESTGS